MNNIEDNDSSYAGELFSLTQLSVPKKKQKVYTLALDENPITVHAKKKKKRNTEA